MKVTAPLGQRSCLTGRVGPRFAHPDPVWFVDGVAYTDDPVELGWFERRGYTVEAGDPTQAFLDAVEALKAETSQQIGAGAQDALNPC